MTHRSEQVQFNRYADEKRFHNRRANPWLRKKEESQAAFVAGRTGTGRVLEVGCGEGSNLIFLRQALPKNTVVGMDLSLGKIRFARDHVEGASVLAGDALSLPYADGAFETVLCRDLLHHVDFARGEVLAEALRVTRPGGNVIIMESHGRMPLNLLMQAIYPAERGMFNSTPQSLKKLAADTGHAYELIPIECSQLIRAAGFILGWSEGWRLPVNHLVYGAASIWENCVERILPERNWAYMALVVEK